MARKKTTARKNTRQVKKTTTTKTKTNLNAMQVMEKEILTARNAATAQIKKTISHLKQQQAKLKKTQAKVAQQMKALETRAQAATQKKLTAASKKQLKKTNTSLKTALTAQANIDKQVQTLNAAVTEATSNQAKIAAIGKNLTRFNKDWAKQAKAAKKNKIQASATKAAKKAKKTNKIVTKSAKDITAEQNNVHSFMLTVDDTKQEDTANETEEVMA